MKLALIAPVSMLDRYAAQSDGIHLCLAYMTKDPAYCAWYKKRSEAGDTIIMDNNAYENGEPATVFELVEAARRVGATTVVAPDYPGKRWQQTVEAYKQFRDELPEPFQILGIPQSVEGDVDGWVKGFRAIAEDHERLSHIGMSILACPNAFQFESGTKDIELNRFMATAYARLHCRSKADLDAAGIRVHYFGFGERLDLLPYYRSYGNSMDTKGPIKAGLAGLNSWGSKLPRGGKAKLDLLTTELADNDHRHHLIQQNVNNLKDWMQRELAV